MLGDGLGLVRRAEEAVLAALPKRLSDKALARAVGVMTVDLHRAFLLVRGVPIYTALHALRLDEADRMLTGDHSISPEAVALQCGFGHYGVFHRNYRRRFKREPGVEDVAADHQPDHPPG
jgi:transcriptional regulator GlxA family with amidase domain